MRFTADVADRLRQALASADHTVDAVFAVLGPDAHAALGRNETVPARRATADGSPLSTLVRLFQLGLPVERASADVALPGLVDDLLAARLVEASGAQVRARVDVRPYGDELHDWWVVCDLTPGLDASTIDVSAHHVLGISEASSSLAQLTVRHRSARAWDLGTGCGVQALHLSQHCDHVVATDVNPRALDMTRMTAALNGIELDVRRGSLAEPVAGERFDLIVSNPPFVVSPPDGERLVYRETGFPGDDVMRRIVEGAADHLNPGGWCQILGSWIHPADADWQERLAGWIEGTGLDAWVVEREELDPASYAEMWLADAGRRGRAGYVQRYDEWLDWFERQGIGAMGFGWINLHRAERDVPALRIESFGAAVAPPVGPAIARWSEGVTAMRRGGSVLRHRWRAADGLVQQTHGPVGAVDPSVIEVRLQHGLQRTRQVDTLEAGLLSASDGELTAGQILDALAELLDLDPVDVVQRGTAIVEALVDEGFLVP